MLSMLYSILMIQTIAHLLVSIKKVIQPKSKNECLLKEPYKEVGFKPIHKRWIAERMFSGMDNDKRLCRNYKQTFDSAEGMVKISTIKLLLKKI